jgi:hypothetical protein
MGLFPRRQKHEFENINSTEPMSTTIQFVLLALVVQPLGAGGLLSQAANVLQRDIRVSTSQPAIEARDLPIEQSMRLRTLALAGASSTPGARIKSPHLAEHGWDPAVSEILEQQRAYLRRRAVSVRETRFRAGALLGLFKAGIGSPSCLSPAIAAVNGRAAGPVFTPQLGDNHYRIEGCGFGAAPGEVRLEPDTHSAAPARPLKITFELDGSGAWSDSEIHVRLDPQLAGMPDFMATLVIAPADGSGIELHGCRFIAVRGEPISLKTIAAPWAKLDTTATALRPITQLEFLSPPGGGDEVPPDAMNMSALVVRSDPDPFSGGTDYYDLSGLNAGWVIESIQLQHYSAVCPGDVIRTDQPGAWDVSLDARSFTVSWTLSSCSSFVPPVFRFEMSSSQYAVKVWVIGPLGTEPVRGDTSQVHKENEIEANPLSKRRMQ